MWVKPPPTGGRFLNDVKDSGRDGITGARKTGDIGFVAVRGGDIVGEHDVLFAGPGERIVLRHVATDRALLRGALCVPQFGHLHNLRANIRCWMCWAYKPLFRFIRFHARARQCIGAFIFWVSRMSFDPLPRHVVTGLRSIQPLP